MLTEEQCLEIDREFLQFYHRRICCLALREFDRAVADADHTLALMDFVAAHSPDAQWTALARALPAVRAFPPHPGGGPGRLWSGPGPRRPSRRSTPAWSSSARSSPAGGRRAVRARTKWSAQLEELKESLRKEYHVGRTLAEQLADAVAAEEYERAARLRDEIARRDRIV